MLRSFFLLLAISFLSPCVEATTIDLNFEGFQDSTILTTQYAGVTFSDAIILTAGISLDEFEFPPHSGVNVISDNGGPINILFSTPINSFSGYFTYAKTLTLDAYDGSNNFLASTTSPYLNNEAMSGEPGSSPNNFLLVSSAVGISRVTIEGDLAGGSFVLDDAAYTSAPEPSYFPAFALLALGSTTVVGLFSGRRFLLANNSKLGSLPSL